MERGFGGAGKFDRGNALRVVVQALLGGLEVGAGSGLRSGGLGGGEGRGGAGGGEEAESGAAIDGHTDIIAWQGMALPHRPNFDKLKLVLL